jgi:hypothetical protein
VCEVRYLRAHNFDSDESGIIRVFNVLRSTLLRARCDDGGVPLSDRLRGSQLARYRAKQSNLDKRGVAAAVVAAVCSHPPGVEGNAADVALELLQEMLHAGNATVQASVLK